MAADDAGHGTPLTKARSGRILLEQMYGMEQEQKVHGKARAAELWHSHRLSIPVDLRRLVAELGLEVVTFPFRGRLKEVIIDRVIGVAPGLPRPWFRWYVAHALGHFVLHVGTGFYLESWQWVSHAKAERQAEEFAAWLLGGPDGWRRPAEELGIPPDKLLLVKNLARQAISRQQIALPLGKDADVP